MANIQTFMGITALLLFMWLLLARQSHSAQRLVDKKADDPEFMSWSAFREGPRDLAIMSKACLVGAAISLAIVVTRILLRWLS